MEVVWTILICGVLGLTGYLMLRDSHENDMKELAAECSTRIQQMNRELVLVCTQAESPEANEIILRHRLNQSAEQLIKQNIEEHV